MPLTRAHTVGRERGHPITGETWTPGQHTGPALSFRPGGSSLVGRSDARTSRGSAARTSPPDGKRPPLLSVEQDSSPSNTDLLSPLLPPPAGAPTTPGRHDSSSIVGSPRHGAAPTLERDGGTTAGGQSTAGEQLLGTAAQSQGSSPQWNLSSRHSTHGGPALSFRPGGSSEPVASPLRTVRGASPLLSSPARASPLLRPSQEEPVRGAGPPPPPLLSVEQQNQHSSPANMEVVLSPLLPPPPSGGTGTRRFTVRERNWREFHRRRTIFVGSSSYAEVLTAAQRDGPTAGQRGEQLGTAPRGEDSSPQWNTLGTPGQTPSNRASWRSEGVPSVTAPHGAAQPQPFPRGGGLEAVRHNRVS